MKVDKTTVAKATSNSGNSKFDNRPLIPADKSKYWAKILAPWVFWLVERHFSSLRVKNKENYFKANPKYGNLLYSAHSCFHDGQVAYYLCRKVFNANFHMMIEDLYKLPILSKLGAFSVEKYSPVESLKSINYAANLLSDSGTMIWIFPQGRVMPPDYRPIKFESGLTYICKKVGGLNLIPVAVKYAFTRDDKPDIFMEIGEPIIIDSGISNKKEFAQFIEDDLTALSDEQIKLISQGEIDDYEIIYKNKQPIFRRLEPYFKNIVFDRRSLNKLNELND